MSGKVYKNLSIDLACALKQLEHKIFFKNIAMASHLLYMFSSRSFDSEHIMNILWKSIDWFGIWSIPSFLSATSAHKARMWLGHSDKYFYHFQETPTLKMLWVFPYFRWFLWHISQGHFCLETYTCRKWLIWHSPTIILQL